MEPKIDKPTITTVFSTLMSGLLVDDNGFPLLPVPDIFNEPQRVLKQRKVNVEYDFKLRCNQTSINKLSFHSSISVPSRPTLKLFERIEHGIHGQVANSWRKICPQIVISYSLPPTFMVQQKLFNTKEVSLCRIYKERLYF